MPAPTVPLTGFQEIELPDTDYFLVLGPLGPKHRRRRLRLTVDQTSGTYPDYQMLNMAAALVETPVTSVENLGSGINVLGQGQFTVPGTGIYLMNPFVIVGERVEYTMPLPDLPDGSLRYLLLYLNAVSFSGSPISCVTASIAHD